MPLIPGVNQRSVTPDAANTPYFKIEATADEFGTGIGKSMLGLENGVIDAANTAFDVKQKLAAKAKPKPPQGDDGYHIVLPMPQFSPDLSKAIDATNTFNAGAQDLTSSFLQLSGKDAVDGQAEAQRGIDQLKDQVLANASTPAAGDRAQQAVSHWADGAKSIIDRHATAQQRVYDDDLDNTQVALGGNSVGLLYNDDQHYLTQLHVASQARADQVLRAAANDNPAADPDTLAATIASAQQATASDYTRTRIESALGQGDLATATALHQRWGGDLLPADQDAVNQHLTYASFNQQSQQAGSQAMSINQPASLGGQRNADMVLHRSGGGDGDQVADAGNAGGQGSTSSLPSDALSPLWAGPSGTQMTDSQVTSSQKPTAAGTGQISGDDETSTKAEESSSMPPGTANHAMFGRGRSKKPADASEPPTFVFHLNSQSISALEDKNGQSFAAFSGNGSATNDPAKTSAENSGPLPKGTYYIVARHSGGRLGALEDSVYKIISGGMDRNEWFSLYRADGTPDDSTSIDGVTRGAFRLHPIGPKGLSEGCITIKRKTDFDTIRRLLITGNTRLIPGTNVPYYGTVLVQ